MPEREEMPALGETGRDHGVALLKGSIGMIPLAGSIIAEMVGTLIPQQRVERIEAYIRKLEERLSAMDDQNIRDRLSEPERMDLFEEGAQQSVRSLSEERREYIASVVAKGVSGEEIAKIEAKRMLNLLRAIDDDQMIMLASEIQKNRHNDFARRHKSLLDLGRGHLGAPTPDFVERQTMYKIARAELMRLGLLQPQFQPLHAGETPRFDRATGTLKASSVELSTLGRKLLEYASLIKPGER